MRVKVNSHLENWPLYSKGFRDRLEHCLYKASGSTPKKKTLDDLLREMKGHALFDAPERQVALRVAAYDGNLYLDLCDEAWRVVEITADGWRTVSDPPIRFQRKPGMLALPEPVSGGSIKELRSFLPRITRDQEILLLSWLMMTYRPTGPYPILGLYGPQGSAKSTTAGVIRRLIDPNEASLRAAPRNERDLLISTEHAYLSSFDNLSRISNNLSDALCRLSTGAGFATRRLYTDQDQIIFAARRPILLNGIETLGERGDLLDRMLVLRFQRIDDADRREEQELGAAFEAAQPRILGSLLDVASTALRNLPGVKLPKRPRMADFACWATACEQALGFGAGDFMRAYEKNRTESRWAALEASPAASEIVKLVSFTSPWEGTYQALLKDLNRATSAEVQRDPHWPRSARALSAAVSRAEADLTVAGITLERLPREAGTGRRFIRFSCPAKKENKA